jgi:hypothetical protein
MAKTKKKKRGQVVEPAKRKTLGLGRIRGKVIGIPPSRPRPAKLPAEKS